MLREHNVEPRYLSVCQSAGVLLDTEKSSQRLTRVAARNVPL